MTDFEHCSCLFSAHFLLLFSSRTAELTVLNEGLYLTPGASPIGPVDWLPQSFPFSFPSAFACSSLSDRIVSSRMFWPFR